MTASLVANIAAAAGIAVFVAIAAYVVITMFFPPKTTPYEVPTFTEAPTLSWVIKGSAPVPSRQPGRHRLAVTR